MHEVFTRASEKEQNNFMWNYCFPGVSPIMLHQGMFIQSLVNFGSEEQKAHYVPQANNLNIIGCYAQTELGHGSNVAGLESLATYDPETE